MPVIATSTDPEMAGDLSLLSEEKRAALGPNPVCDCIPFVKKSEGYCPDMRKCKYSNTIIALHALQDQPVRKFEMHLSEPKEKSSSTTTSTATTTDAKESAPCSVTDLFSSSSSSSGGSLVVAFDIVQNKANLHNDEDGTGFVVWNSAVWLKLFLGNVAIKSGDVRWMAGRRVLELGAGTGLGSVACVVCGAASVVASDRVIQPAIDNFTKLGLLSSSSSSSPSSLFPVVRTCEYSWGKSSPVTDIAETMPFDLILLSDVLYFSKNYEPLLESVFVLLSAQCDTQENKCTLQEATTLPLLLLSQKHREVQEEEKFRGPLRDLFNIYQIDEYEHSRGGKVSFINQSSFHMYQGRERELETQDPDLRMVVFVPKVIDTEDMHQMHWMLQHVTRYLVEIPASSS